MVAYRLDQPWDRDRDAVQSGMEMLGWDLGQSGAAALAHRIRSEGGELWLLIILLMVAWVGAGIVIFHYVAELSSSWATFLTSVVVGWVLFAIGWVYRRVRPDPVRQRQSIAYGTLVFTSTGVTIGEHARLWHATDYKLRAISLEQLQLSLDFGAHGAFEIPVPAHFENDVREMVQMLRGRTAALETNMLPSDPPKPTKGV